MVMAIMMIGGCGSSKKEDVKPIEGSVQQEESDTSEKRNITGRQVTNLSLQMVS